MYRFLGINLLVVIAQLFLPLFALGADEGEYVDAVDARVRATYESVNLPENESMGFLGTTVLFDVNSWLSTGIGTYGALAGDRGGFITLGGAVEARREIASWAELNSGVFLGAGGGRGGLELAGGGLMLRYHLGIKVKSDGWGSVGGGVSYLDFPYGTITSRQLYLSYEYPFDTLLSPGWFDSYEPVEDGRRPVPGAEHEFGVVMRTYRVLSGVTEEDGATPQHSTINLLGVEWNRYFDEHLFIRVESEGAMGGESSGYMQTLFGVGYRASIFDGTSIRLTSSAGMAGGGNVATGGGLLVDATVAAHRRLGDHLYGELAAGYVFATSGDFEAISYAAKLGYHFDTPAFSDDRVALFELKGYEPQNIRLRTAHQSYIKAADNWREHHEDTNVDLLGFQADYFMSKNYFITGQGIAAYRGDAGAFMTGLVGAGLYLSVFETPFYVEAELLGGAAGGGGLAVGGGLVWQANAGLGYELSDRYSAQLSYGYMSAPRGEFKARVYTFSVGYKFNIFTR